MTSNKNISSCNINNKWAAEAARAENDSKSETLKVQENDVNVAQLIFNPLSNLLLSSHDVEP